MSITTPAGQPVQTTVSDIVSGIILQNDVFDQPDAFGRPQRISHLDGTTNLVSYDCCGMASSTDRDGVQTQFFYTNHHQKTNETRNGSAKVWNLDLYGRVIQTLQIGTNGTSTVLSGFGYNGFGEVIAETNSLGGVTTYSKYFNSGDGHWHSDTTYPDGSTRLETYFNDRRLASVTGTAVTPMAYDYGTGVLSYLGIYYNWTRETRLETNGTPTSEWVEHRYDLADHEIYTLYSAAPGYPNPTYEMVYNSKGQLTKKIDPDGVVTLYQYNTLGEIEYEALDVNRDGVINFSGLDRITRILRDVTTNSVVHANVIRERHYSWDTLNTDSATLVWSSETSVNGLTNWTVAWNGSAGATNISVTQFLGSGSRRVTQTAPDGTTTITDFLNGRSQSITRKDSGGGQVGKVNYSYDAYGRVKTETDARNGATTYLYNTADQLISVTTPAPGDGSSAQVISNFYDNLGRLWKVLYADGTSLTNEFTLRGELKKRSGSGTVPVEYSYDYAGRTASVKTWRDYIGNANTATTAFTYDVYRGLLTDETFNGAAGPHYSYSYAGQLSSKLWARGTNVTYTYNDSGDLWKVTYDDGATPGLTNTYDRRGRTATVFHNGITNTFAYNGANEVLSLSWAGGTLNGLMVTNDYDSLLRKSATRLNGYAGTVNSYSYDTAGRISTVGDGTNSVTYSYLTDSPLISQALFKSNSATRLTTTRQYDFLNRLRSLGSVTGGDGYNDSYNYTFNAANQRARVTSGDGRFWLHDFDSLGQVTSGKRFWSDGTPMAGQQFEYAFDTLGNRTSTQEGGDQYGGSLRSATYGANNLNQYTNRTVPGTAEIIGSVKSAASVTVDGSSSVYRHGGYYERAVPVNNSSAAQFPALTVSATLGTNTDSITGSYFVAKTPETYTYDADGNLTQDGRWSYTWDGDNRLVQILSLTNTPTTSKFKLTFDYDAWGRRIQAIVLAWTNSTWTGVFTNRYLYDHWNLLAELNATNGLLRAYLWGLDVSGSLHGAGGVGGLIALKDPANGGHFYSYDGNGNVTALTAAANGKLSALYEYGPFLEGLRATGPLASLNPFTASTKFKDIHTGFLYYGERYYDSDAGRWLSRDPLGLTGGLNLYGFNGNDPLDFIDPDGLRAGDFWDPQTYWCRTKGFAKGSWDQVAGLAHMITSPQETMNGVVDAFYNYDETWRSIKETVHDAFIQYTDSKKGCIDPCIALEMEGKIASEIVSMFVGVGEVAKLSEALKLGKISELVKAELAALKSAGTASKKGGVMYPKNALLSPMNEEWAGSLASEGNNFKKTVNLGHENIFYRESELFQENINDVRPFNQALSDAQQPIQAVQTPEGLHIMQGNNRVYGAMLDDQTIQMNVYTPAQWHAQTGMKFNPNWSTPKPIVLPGRR